MSLIRGAIRERIVGEYSAGAKDLEYEVLAEEWRTVWYSGASPCTHFKVSIREIATGRLWSLERGSWDDQKVQDTANAIAMLLGDDTQSYTPDGCMEMFT
jgi:hypothetical protein